MSMRKVHGDKPRSLLCQRMLQCMEVETTGPEEHCPMDAKPHLPLLHRPKQWEQAVWVVADSGELWCDATSFSAIANISTRSAS